METVKKRSSIEYFSKQNSAVSGMVNAKISSNTLYQGVAKTRLEHGEADNMETSPNLAHPYPCAKIRGSIEVSLKSSVKVA